MYKIVTKCVDTTGARCTLHALLAVDAVPAGAGLGGDGVVQVVVQELAPLHHHVRQPRVRGHAVRLDDAGGHQPRRGLGEAEVLEVLVPADRGAQAVLVLEHEVMDVGCLVHKQSQQS